MARYICLECNERGGGKSPEQIVDMDCPNCGQNTLRITRVMPGELEALNTNEKVIAHGRKLKEEYGSFAFNDVWRDKKG